MSRQRIQQPGTMRVQPKRKSYSPQSTRTSAAVRPQKGRPVPNHPIVSRITNANLGNLSGQLHTVADHLGTFSQIADFMKQYNGLSGSVPGRGPGLNFMNVLKNGNSINHLLKAFLPAFEVSNLGKGEKK
ncbi:MAG: hypothetical protein AAGU27_28185 [Dehalobacterium sp.]